VAVVVLIIDLALGGYGVWLTWLGAGTGASSIKLFGLMDVSTTSVGLGCVALSAAVALRVLPRVLKP
jgi:hypothetical protein